LTPEVRIVKLARHETRFESQAAAATRNNDEHSRDVIHFGNHIYGIIAKEAAARPDMKSKGRKTTGEKSFLKRGNVSHYNYTSVCGGARSAARERAIQL
jgi:hypothetical protein